MLTRTTLRGVRAHAPTAMWAQPAFLRQAAPRAPQLSQIAQRVSPQKSSRWISSLPFRRATTLANHPAPGPSSARRAFTTNPNPQSQYNRYNQYNRFGNNRSSLFFTLVHNAKPHHFVILGLGISGVYFYNTDVVSVSQPQSRTSL